MGVARAALQSRGAGASSCRGHARVKRDRAVCRARGNSAAAAAAAKAKSQSTRGVGGLLQGGGARKADARRVACRAGVPWTADQAWGLAIGAALVAVWFLSTKVDKIVADAQRRQLELDEDREE
mmetsp:Transcript_2675/g.7092  ORF Transcript_2675/g.7092 Transcript_2675/m.7092 type:complete len:124 (+) Transcript_2675:3-374(+)